MGYKRAKFMALDNEILEQFESKVPKGQWTKKIEELMRVYVEENQKGGD